MREDDLSRGYMPKTTALLEDQGMRFDDAFVSNPLCCPSRATILRGQYSHNTGVWSPYELENAYEAGAPPSDLAARLRALKGCAGATCRAAEDGP